MIRLVYTRKDLFRLRDRNLPLLRSVRRELWFNKLLLKPAPSETTKDPKPSKECRIPVCITRSRSSSFPRESVPYDEQPIRASRCLVPVPMVCSGKGRRRRARFRFPRILVSNVRSISNKLDEVAMRVSSISPDICVFTESWLDHSVPTSAISLPGFNAYRQDRVGRVGGGIVCYINSVSLCSTFSSSDIPSLSCCNSEFLIIFVNEFNLLLICIYHPFWNEAFEHQSAINCITDVVDFGYLTFGSNLKIVLCGDFNDLRHHFETISTLTQLKYLVNFNTRADHCVDQIFANFACDHKPLSFPPFCRSDHVVISWNPTPVLRKPCIKKKCRLFSPANFARFFEAINSYDWHAFVNSFDNLDDATSSFLHCLFYLFDHSFPQRTVRIRSDEPKWMRMSLKRLIDDRDRAFHRNQLAKYRRLREEVIRHTRFLKRNFILKCANSDDQKDIWKCLRSLGGMHKSRTISKGFSIEDFSCCFSSNFQSVDSMFELESTTSCNLSPAPLSDSEVMCFLRRVPNRSCGPDGLPAWIFRDCSEHIVSALTFIFNWSIRECHVPSCFKVANISPIPKCDKPQSVSDFRPISLLPVLSKILEKIVVRKFILPIVSQKVSSTQFAYIPRPGSGPTTASLLAYHKVLEFLDTSSGAVRILSVDFSKAFDKLLPSVILSSCSLFGLPDFIIRWVSSFLADRKQRVFIDGDVSTWRSVRSGVPQGSILGPVLFCLAMDSLSSVSPNSFMIKYADDVSILHFVRKLSDDNLQDEWDNIVRWSNSNSLPLNRSKCCVLDVVTKKSLTVSSILLHDGSHLTNVSTLSFLGVTFSSDLKWNFHFESAVRKACKRIFIIRNLCRSGCPADLVFKCYTAFLRSVFLFGFPCVCNAPAYLLQKIVNIEKRVMRLMCADPLRFPSFIDVANQMCVNLMNSIEKHECHLLRPIFVAKNVSRTRSRGALYRPLSRTTRFGNSFIKFCS